MNLAFLYLQKWERELEIRQIPRANSAARWDGRHPVHGEAPARNECERPGRESSSRCDRRMIRAEPQ